MFSLRNRRLQATASPQIPSDLPVSYRGELNPDLTLKDATPRDQNAFSPTAPTLRGSMASNTFDIALEKEACGMEGRLGNANQHFRKDSDNSASASSIQGKEEKILPFPVTSRRASSVTTDTVISNKRPRFHWLHRSPNHQKLRTLPLPTAKPTPRLRLTHDSVVSDLEDPVLIQQYCRSVGPAQAPLTPAKVSRLVHSGPQRSFQDPGLACPAEETSSSVVTGGQPADTPTIELATQPVRPGFSEAAAAPIEDVLASHPAEPTTSAGIPVDRQIPYPSIDAGRTVAEVPSLNSMAPSVSLGNARSCSIEIVRSRASLDSVRTVDEALRASNVWNPPDGWRTPRTSPLESPRGSTVTFSERRLSDSLSQLASSSRSNPNFLTHAITAKPGGPQPLTSPSWNTRLSLRPTSRPSSPRSLPPSDSLFGSSLSSPPLPSPLRPRSSCSSSHQPSHGHPHTHGRRHSSSISDPRRAAGFRAPYHRHSSSQPHVFAFVASPEAVSPGSQPGSQQP